MRINSVPYVKGFCNNKNVLRAQSMVWHFVRHPAYWEHNEGRTIDVRQGCILDTINENVIP